MLKSKFKKYTELNKLFDEIKLYEKVMENNYTYSTDTARIILILSMIKLLHELQLQMV